MQCPDPPVVEKAEFRLHSGVNKLPTLGSFVTYTCKKGYELENSTASELHCILDPGEKEAVWKGEIPVCRGKFFVVLHKKKISQLRATCIGASVTSVVVHS